MTCRLVSATLACLMIAGAAAAQAPTTRELERINWMEFREVVPKRIDTVLVPLGTLEPRTAPTSLLRWRSPARSRRGPTR